MKIESGHIVILGAGESGVGAAVLAKKMGWTVFVSDFGSINEKFKAAIIHLGVKWEEGMHTMEELLKADLVVKSPGIPNTAAPVKALKEAGIKVVSEIEFAGFYNEAKTICITGSNGKTTTAMLTYHILKNAGLNVGLAGNIGKSFAKQVAEKTFDWYVLELSSFQLDDMYEFKADIAMLMNITPDHLDRYEYKMENYARSKMRIVQNQTAEDWFIYNYDDPIIKQQIESRTPPKAAAKIIQARQAPFSLKEEIEVGGYLEKKQLTININKQFTMSIHDLALKGKHNAQNSLASGIASRILEIRKESVRESLGDFVNVEHRLEFVAKVHGIEFINDSKATNINSTWFALESMDKPTVWIVGGVDKGNDYSELTQLVDEKVKSIVCLGKDNSKIIEAFSGCNIEIYEAGSAMEAVAYGYRLAKKDETVLLSPACASFDLFENYEERGNEFKKAVRLL
ncbi:UDP-N-acetylmuramoyl-L-alanine--D-glutamate ligase [Crocinitomicaceae bacterium]|nr:UDP-N-acetylmuramoyl-L-alanine--D-glutamate ligase [Crocinitomicaceae bacterium]MDC0098774.1 UDP-N-acetylmuramoyl-L-alanine--D-glutamate ligase [Crocinitomicaceae bacterium]MDC1282551.1 UDP-N-acetylmuramoyl-L-alanine--D-glutamate ligase [Crocinitomicaceae bacterium]|tara:strand:- start:12129 stop:13496 length:1368 start_codon:yes stop_codon:yes gene_type:complete